MRWLYKLEYKHGNKYIPRLMTYIIGGMILVYILDFMIPPISVSALFALDRAAIFSGQVWRLVTFIFVPGSDGFWLVFYLYFYWLMGTSLEQIWGGFRFNLFYLFGIIGAILAALITGYGTNYYLNMSLFLAFAALQPDTTFRLFFILPIKAKWMAAAYLVFIVRDLVLAFTYSTAWGLSSLAAMGFSLLGLIIFFGPTLLNSVKEQVRIAKNRRNWKNNWK